MGRRMTFATSAYKRKIIIGNEKDVVTSQIHQLLVAKCDFLNKIKNIYKKRRRKKKEEDKCTIM